MTPPPPAPTPEPVLPPPAAAGRATLKTSRLAGLLHRSLRWLRWIGLIVAVGVLMVFAFSWWSYRRTHSITNDAFVEAHIVNVAPQTVSGRIVRFLVEENDRVDEGQVLAEIDPVPYRDQVNIARSRVDIARAELRRQEESLARLRVEVPIQIEMARRGSAAAEAEQARALEAIKLTEDEVEKTIDEAEAGLEAAQADLVLAQQEYRRYTRLQQVEAAPLRRAQQVTQARDAAEAQRNLAAARLAKAQADRTRISVAERTHEAAEKTTQKAVEGVSLAETGHLQIREAELLTAVKKEEVEDARLALIAAEDDLRFTQIRAPFPGVVVKRYRHLGDFVSPGVSVLSMYNPELTYVTAYLEEDRLPGVAPGGEVELRLDAFDEPFRGRVVWLNKSTGAQFALMPRNIVSGEFTKVVQRVPVRIAIEKDERWPLLRAGLSVEARIAHGAGDPRWAEQTAREMREIETRYNRERQ